MNWQSSKLKKKCKVNSPQKFRSTQQAEKISAVEEKLNVETENVTVREVVQNAGTEISAVAGKQPRRRP